MAAFNHVAPDAVKRPECVGPRRASVRQSVLIDDSSAILRSGKRCVMRADEKLTAFLELETAIRPTNAELHFLTKPALATQFAPQGSQAE